MADGRAEKFVKPWDRLYGKVVMVTGASSGLGREFCLTLARAGCSIIAAARRTDRLKSLCEEIDRLSSFDPALSTVRSVAVELDVSAKGSIIEASVQKAWEAFGRIDALINNAGIRGNVYGPLEWPEEEWKNMIATNLTGSWLVAKYVCTRMRDAKLKGSVINISSIAGLNRGQLPGSLAYAVTKAGVNTMTKTLFPSGEEVTTEAKSVVSAHSSPFRKWLDGYLTANLDMEMDGIPVSVMTIAEGGGDSKGEASQLGTSTQ